MRVMVMVKATKDSEAGVMPSAKLLADMGKFNEELVKAGVMLAGEGLHAEPQGQARALLAAARRPSSTGPSPRPRSSSPGFWIWQVKSMDEAVEWVRRCPDPMPGEESEIEIRPVLRGRGLRRGAHAGAPRAEEAELRAQLERPGEVEEVLTRDRAGHR